MKLHEYYKKNAINPVPVNSKNILNLRKHFLIRKNLIENHLKIPLFLINNKKILEVGPNTGENSLLFAFNKCRITFVEPSIKSICQLKKNYKKFNKLNYIEKIINKPLESVKINSKFNLVIAEGFLNTLRNRNKHLKYLAKKVDTEGLLIINYDDFYGSFVELVKSNILKKECENLNVPLGSKTSFNIAKRLFLKDYKKFKNSRPFKAYWEDQLASPFAGCIWKFSDIIKILNKSKLYFYSSSPSWFMGHYFKWYKDIDFKKINTKAKISWSDNIDYFLTGYKKINNISLDNANIDQLDNLIKSLSKNLLIKKKRNKIIFSDIFFKKSYKNNNSSLYLEIVKIINFLNSKNNSIQYNKLKNFRKLTGTNLHYVCFVKSQ
jgi:hypothetical protein